VSGNQKLAKQNIKDRVMNALSLVKLDGLEFQPAPLLSGGQQQRVALARALAHEPEVLLLDEPLSNLDAKLREEMRVQIRMLTRRLDVTTIYVTHDQLEALQMSDRIAVMHDGGIVEEGKPKQIYLSPRTAYTAGFVGRVNFFEGLVKASHSEDAMASVETPIGVLACHVAEGSQYSGGEKVLVAVRPEGILLSVERPAQRVNVIRGVLEASMFAGDTQDCIVRVDHREIQVKADPLTDLPANASVFLYLPPPRCVIIRELAG
jgi:iron(III) transport system ATP-binding protein